MMPRSDMSVDTKMCIRDRLGGELDNGFTVSAKYIGNRRIIETAVATLATDRALLLYCLLYTSRCV